MKLPRFDNNEEDSDQEEMRPTYKIEPNKRSLYDYPIKSVVFKSESGPSEKEILSAKTATGDDMTDWLWDGPQDSDEEIEELLPFKNEQEKELGVKYSKNGIKKFIEDMVAHENAKNTNDPENAKLWEIKLDTPNIQFFVKNGGSQFSKDQPFLRTESKFNKMFKMNKVAKMVSIYF